MSPFRRWLPKCRRAETHNLIDRLRDIVQIICGYDGVIHQKFTLGQRHEMVRKFAKALGGQCDGDHHARISQDRSQARSVLSAGDHGSGSSNSQESSVRFTPQLHLAPEGEPAHMVEKT